MEETPQKHTNSRMQKKPNDFGLKYNTPPKKNKEKAEWINNMTRELEGLEYTSIYSKRHKKNRTGKLQTMTEYMVSGSRNSSPYSIPTRNTRTRMDDQRKDHIDPKGPKQRNCPKQLQTQNRWWEKYLQHKYWKIFTTRKQATDCSLRKRKDAAKDPEEHVNYFTLSAYPIREQDQTEKSRYGLDWLQNSIYPQSWIINCPKMYKISHEVINYIEKNMKT